MPENKFHVTDAQLQDILRNENFGIECDETNDTSIHAIVSDLLETRDLIKEMRSIIYGAASYNVDCSCQACQNVKVEIREMLSKTKDYE